MFRNFLKIAVRNLLRRKVYSIINILGLSVGLASCIIIFLFVRNERSYDAFHSKSDRIYRIVREATFSDQRSAMARINYSFAALAKENIAGIEKVTRVGSFSGFISSDDLTKEFDENAALFTDPVFFEVFDVDFIRGSAETALASPNQIVLARSAAERYFGTDDPIGQVLHHNRGEHSFEVIGVIEDWPKQSHMEFDMLISISSTEGWYGESMFHHWGNVWIFTYALVSPGVDQERLDAEVNLLAYEHGPDALAGLNARFFTQKLRDIHLFSNLNGEMRANGSILYVRIFSAVGILILLIACFNFINLATARASWRAKEVGLKKVVGAQRQLLIVQFLGESLLTTIFSFLVALFITLGVLPIFNDYTGLSLTLNDLLSAKTILLGLLVLVAVGTVAGSFPAFMLSAFRPVDVLKGNTNVGNTKLASGLRKALVVMQFSISICLVVASLTIYYQLGFARNIALGYDKEHVVVLDLYNKDLREKGEILKNTLLGLPDVTDVSGVSDTPPGGLNSWWLNGKGPYAAVRELVPILAVDQDFVSTLKLQIAEGRDFGKEIASDESSAVLLNQAAVKFLGFEDPVGTDVDIQNGRIQGTVVGVVKDFHTSSVHDQIGPVMMLIWPSWLDQVMVRLSPGDYGNSLSSIEKAWETVYPTWNMRYHFLDDDFNKAYHAEERLSQLIFTFSVLAIIIGVLGLFGLANYVAEQKMKEIGIRKVMGATLGNVVWLQYQSFLSLLVAAFFVSVPFTAYFMSDWLEQFAYRVELQWWLFLAGGLFTFVVSIGTVSFQSLKAALRNPVDSLRTE